MELPDEIALKAEIQEITDRIDHIIETVNQYHDSLNREADAGEAGEPVLP